ncbi:MAG: inorganic diphosphatase, partial [Lachnospiraceae bacterium]|nr:inorganic diphosphatase [Lachnospiraceae bacterium]
TNGPAYFRAEPVGCTSTIIWTIMREKELTPPKQIAGLMLSAILSDTLCFRSPTCTARDVNAAEALAKIAEVDINEYAKRMFEAGEDLTGRSGLDILYTDFKIFTYGDLKFGVGQSTFMTEKNRKMAEELVKPVLEQALAKSGIEMVFYMATDTPSKTTDLYCAGENADMIARFAFKTEPQEDGAYILHDVVSRKKQMIPPLRMAMQAQL